MLFDHSPLRDIAVDDLQEQYSTVSGRDQASDLNSGASSVWILRPELLDEYYKGSIWMFWVTIICNAYLIMMTCLLLEPGFTWDTNLKDYVINDTVSQAQNMIVWFIFAQGVTVQISILLASLIEMKLKHRGAIHATLLITYGGFITASVYLFIFIGLVPESLELSQNTSKYGVPMFCVAGTFALFIIALTIKQISSYIRSQRH